MRTPRPKRRPVGKTARKRAPVPTAPVKARSPKLRATTEGSAFPVVGVGASAGGLEAFTQLLRALPIDTGMGFVLVQHLAPTHSSSLAEILSRATKMPVMEVRDEPPVRPNHVYIIPPARNMVIQQGRLQLLPRAEHGRNLPIDLFLRTLARDQGHRAIGVILSGTASDGSLGLQEIKAEGGITFAQDDSAQHGGMPHSAIATGCVDFVLPPARIAEEIARIAKHPYVAPVPKPGEDGDAEPMRRILMTLRSACGVDFTHYKANTLLRRITRRMVLHKMAGLREYAQHLRGHTDEVEALYQDLLINVTSFFRDPGLFEALKGSVFPELIRNRSDDEPLRVWVQGCSTGEEAYSIAMSYVEFAEASGQQAPLQVFATDLNATGIERARAGVFSKAIVNDVSQERLGRFFVEVDGTFRVSREVRDMCVFARHNLLSDPPFSRVNLISCRNLLIYLEPVLQERIIPLLHYALKPGGFLVLGISESIGSYRDLFRVEDAKNRIYARTPGHAQPLRGTHRHGKVAAQPMQGKALGRPQGVAEWSGTEIQKEADRVLLAQYAPSGVVIDGNMEIVQFRGDTGPYLTPAPGKASLNVLKMAREGLLVALRSAIQKARTEKTPARASGLQVKSNGGMREVDLEVLALKGGSDEASGFLILFREPAAIARSHTAAAREGKRVAPSSTARDREATERELARLTQELVATREYLQSVIEQQEGANEELQSANEEVQSSNEELQSINEELETSKEEIQSSNEELATVNDELRNRNLELGRVNSDLVNLLASVQMAIVFVGQDLRIRRFTPQAERTFHLLPTDIGRPLSDLKLARAVPDLEPLLKEAIDNAHASERELRDERGRWFSLRIRPYHALDNKIDGALLVWVNVDSLKRAQRYAESIIASVREALVILDSDLRILSANESFYRMFPASARDSDGRHLYEIGSGQWNIPELRRLLDDVLTRDTYVKGYMVQQDFEGIGRKVLALDARRLEQLHEARPCVLLAIEDVTERTDAATALKARVEQLATQDRTRNEFLATLAHELRNPLAPLWSAAKILRTPAASVPDREKARAMIERQVQFMARMIDDLLDVSRITGGKVRLRKEPVALTPLLQRALDSARHRFESREQKVEFSPPTEHVYVDADTVRLEQVFGNLLNNASKFTSRRGNIRVSVEVERGPEPGAAAVAVVRVRDDGVGLAADLLPRVFDLFVQADPTRERAEAGLGIGLTLVRSLVEQHSGSVTARSPGLGHGSEFEVRLPALEHVGSEAPGPREPAVSPAESSFQPSAATPRRVLVVDDNPDACESLAAVLRLAGHQVEAALDGPSALKAAEAIRPDAVILDIGLPGMDGYALLRRFRQERASADALYIALTGYGRDEDRSLALEAGFDHHFTKPVDPDRLLLMLAHTPLLSAPDA